MIKFVVEFSGRPAGWLVWHEATQQWEGEVDGPGDTGGAPEDWAQIVSEVIADQMSGGPYFAGRWRGWTWGLAD